MMTRIMNNDRDPDALMRALFAEGDRPPMGDETFVRGVMARVEADAARSKAWRNTAAPAIAALGAAAIWPFLGPLGAIVGQAFAPILANAPSVGAGGLTVLMAFAAAGGAWLYSERA